MILTRIPKSAGGITYKYILRGEDGINTVELVEDKVIIPSQTKANELVLIDSWNYPGYYENIFYTKPFKEVLFKIVLVALPSLALGYYLMDWLFFENRIWTLLVTSVLISFFNITFIFFVGLKNNEKQMIINFIKNKL